MTSRPVSAVSAAAVAAVATLDGQRRCEPLVPDDRRPGPVPRRAGMDPAGRAPDDERGLCAYAHPGPCRWPGEATA